MGYCPALEKYAATTWGYTKEEARRHIYEVVEMVVQELMEDEEPIPDDLADDLASDDPISSDSKVAITI